MTRYFIRYHSRPRLGDEELYVLADMATNTAVSEPMIRSLAEAERKRRDAIDTEVADRAKYGDPDASPMVAFCPGLNFNPGDWDDARTAAFAEAVSRFLKASDNVDRISREMSGVRVLNEARDAQRLFNYARMVDVDPEPKP